MHTFIGQLGHLCVILGIKFSKIWCCTIHWLWECYHSGPSLQSTYQMSFRHLPALLMHMHAVKPEFLWPLIHLIMDPNDRIDLSGIRSASACPWHSLMLHLTDNTGWSGPPTPHTLVSAQCSVTAPDQDKWGGLSEHICCVWLWT